MNEKYEITGFAHPSYPWLHRIRALRDVREDVCAGDLGGYVDNETNLSTTGSCWIYDDAVAYEDAIVAEESTLHGHACACGSALVAGNAEMRDDAIANDNAIIHSGKIQEKSIVAGNGAVMANPAQSYSPVVKGYALVMGTVRGNVEVSGHQLVRTGEHMINNGKETLRLNASSYFGHPSQEAPEQANRKKRTVQER